MARVTVAISGALTDLETVTPSVSLGKRILNCDRIASRATSPEGRSVGYSFFDRTLATAAEVFQ